MRKDLRGVPLSNLAASTLVCLSIMTGTTQAHPPWDDQLDVLAEQIREEPLNPSLYVRRADLKKELGDLKGALSDYDRATEIDPAFVLADLGRGLLYLGDEDPELAQFYLDRFLEQHPDHAKALLASARSLRQLQDFATAADRYERAIDGFKMVKPGFFVELAEVQVAAGEHIAAVETLDEGLRRFGALTSLQIRAIDILADRGETQEALHRLEKLSKTSPQTAKWLLRKGEVLESAGRWAEAEAAYSDSKVELDKQLTGNRKSRSLMALEEQIGRAQRRLESRSSSQGESS